MKTQWIVTVVVLVIGLRLLACSLASAMPYIAVMFVMVVVGRLIWYYTKS